MEAFSPSQILESLQLNGTIHGTSTGQKWMQNNETITSNSPIDNLVLGSVSVTTKEQYEAVVSAASEAFKSLRSIPAPKRGEFVRQFGNALREEKAALGGPRVN